MNAKRHGRDTVSGNATATKRPGASSSWMILVAGALVVVLIAGLAIFGINRAKSVQQRPPSRAFCDAGIFHHKQVVSLIVEHDMRLVSCGRTAVNVNRVAVFADRQELVARMEAALQRAQPRPSTAVQIGPLLVCPGERLATWRGEALCLSPREFDILTILVERYGSVVSRDYLFDHLWGLGFAGEARLIDRHVMKLRQKLQDGANQIETVWGVGYRLSCRLETMEQRTAPTKSGAHA